MSRVEQAIRRAQDAGRGALIGYLPVGFPDLETSIQAAITLAENGADVIELGPPYSDPVMDGPVIQEATQTALAAGVRTRDLFTAVKAITAATDVPVVVMSYWNLVVQYGIDRYAADLLAAGGAGLITPDITPEAAGEWITASERTGLDRIFLAAPTSTDERLDLIVRNSTGFIYTVSTMGITGERAELDRAARTLVERLRAHGATRACVGIGISTAEQRAEDGDAAFPDGPHGPGLERVPGVAPLAEVEVRVGEHVEDAGADDRDRDREDRDVDDHPRLRTALGEAVVGHQHGHDDADDDAQRVEMDPDRTEVDVADIRARDAGEHAGEGAGEREGHESDPSSGA